MGKARMSDLGFRYQIRKSGEVVITNNGMHATTLRGGKAASFQDDATTLDDKALQQEMARLTGNYRRGNERVPRKNPKNR